MLCRLSSEVVDLRDISLGCSRRPELFRQDGGIYVLPRER